MLHVWCSSLLSISEMALLKLIKNNHKYAISTSPEILTSILIPNLSMKTLFMSNGKAF